MAIYKQDKSNKWWFYPKSGKRTAAETYKCYYCNADFIRTKSMVKPGKSIYCSKKCSNLVTGMLHTFTRVGPANYAWQGGRKKVEGGYIRTHKRDHPRADNHGCILEHRLVMESMIGRYLLPEETIHHKNGIRDDNRPENLELFVSAHPAGQRVEDLIEFAEWVLKTYKTNNK